MKKLFASIAMLVVFCTSTINLSADEPRVRFTGRFQKEEEPAIREKMTEKEFEESMEYRIKNLFIPVDDSNLALAWAGEWGHGRDRLKFAKLALFPIGHWISDRRNPAGRVEQDVKDYFDSCLDASGNYALLVLSTSDQRSEYAQWYSNAAKGIGQEMGIMIWEPDIITVGSRLEAVAKGFQKLHTDCPNMYIFPGAPWGNDPSVTADRLIQIGIKDAEGFAVNVGSTHTVEESTEFCRGIGAALRSKGISKKGVIDVSRAGQGRHHPVSLGPKPRVIRDDPDVIAWVYATPVTNGPHSGVTEEEPDLEYLYELFEGWDISDDK